MAKKPSSDSKLERKLENSEVEKEAEMLAATREAGHGPNRRFAAAQQDVGNGGIVLQNSFCTGDQRFCGLQARLSYKDVRDLIASR
jgi:hypothetical protein